MKKKPSLAQLTEHQEDDDLQEYSNDIKSDELLTIDAKKDPLSPPSGRKSPLDEYVMVGIRMTKRQRKATKMLANDLDMTIQELVRQAIVMFRDSKGVR